MKLFNTLSHQIEELRAIKTNNIGLYSCGPTVYDFSHIGHYRTYIGVDLLKRTLTCFGYKVFHVENITDVGHLTSDEDTGEDKLEKGAKREGKTVWEIASFYTKDFFEAMEGLNILKPDIICKATDHIKEMIDLILILEKKGYTYQISDGIYFNTSKDKNYGKLAGFNPRQIKAGARVEMVLGKKNPTDFALWKFSPPEKSGIKRQMEWNSPWGKGFPGWHIECSAMSTKYLGQPFDIHTGGIDHIPIHHTNEIAQSENANSKKLANYWIHFNFLKIDNQKMSKSLGNIYNQKEIINKGFSLLDLRYLFLTCHYRDELNFTWESLAGAQKAYANLKSAISSIYQDRRERTSLSLEKQEKVQHYKYLFEEALKNDLAMPSAVSILWQVIKSNISSFDKWELISDFDQIFGLKLTEAQEEKTIQVPKEIKLLIAQRAKLRNEKKWNEADKIRELIEKSGYLVIDAKEQQVTKKVRNALLP